MDVTNYRSHLPPFDDPPPTRLTAVNLMNYILLWFYFIFFFYSFCFVRDNRIK